MIVLHTTAPARRRHRHGGALLAVAVGLALLAVSTGPAAATGGLVASEQDPVVTAGHAAEGRVLVRWRPGLSAAGRAAVVAELVPERQGEVTPISAHVEAVPVRDAAVSAVIQRLRADDRVVIAEPDHVLEITPGLGGDPADAPDDPHFDDQWGLRNVGQTVGPDTSPTFALAGIDVRLLSAWSVTRGDPSVLVAVIDAPIDTTHPDLDGAVTGQVGPALDVEITPSPHGTSVASVIAARADDAVGMAGVAPGVSILSVAAFRATDDGSDTSSLADVLRAFEVAREAEADIINASWVTTHDSELLRSAVAEAGVPVVAASGNDFRLLQPGDRLYPAAYDLPNLVTVTAVDPTGLVPGFANVGAEVVDVGAPGAAVLGAVPDGGYALFDGTSFAAPHVTGALALARSAAPYATTGELVDAVSWTSRPLVSLTSTTRTGGMLDIGALVRGVQRPVCRQDLLPPAGFSDVPRTNTHARAIDCLAAVEVTAGTGDGTYGPAGSVTREQVASFLATIVEQVRDLTPPPPAGFLDVPDGAVHGPSIDRLAELGILRGDGQGRFRPREAVTRGQLASLFVATHAVLTEGSVPPSRRWFSDTEGSVHAGSIDRARDLGMIRGVDRVRFAPATTSRRDQLATMLAGSLDALVREGVELR